MESFVIIREDAQQQNTAANDAPMNNSVVQRRQAASQRPSGFKKFEPDFKDRTGELQKDLVPDWLAIMLQENRDHMQKMQLDLDDDTSRLFFSSKSVEYLFTICLRLRLSHDVMYLAMEIFNKFMIAHIKQLYEMIRTQRNLTPPQRVAQWEKVFTTISRQIPLRTLTSIQIASKMHSSKKGMATGDIVTSLQTLGYAYTEDAVRKSELRVMKTIDWCGSFRQTPVTFLETFLAMLFRMNGHIQFQTTAIWEYSLLILDCIFIHSDEFYNRISMVTHGERGKLAQKERLNRLKADYVLLVAGVITTACTCVHGTDFASTVITTLQQITGVPMDSISNFFTGIFQTIHDHKIHNPLVISRSLCSGLSSLK